MARLLPFCFVRNFVDPKEAKSSGGYAVEYGSGCNRLQFGFYWQPRAMLGLC